MWAEIAIRINAALPHDLRNRATNYFQDATADRTAALEETELGIDLLPHTLLARRSKGVIMLLINSDAQKVKAYVNNNAGPKTLESLKREIKALHEDLRRFLNTCGLSIQELTVTIGVQDDVISVGEHLNFSGRLKEAFKDHAIAKVYVPIATYGASMISEFDQQKAVLNVLTAVIALGIWILLDAIFLRDPFAYQEG
jgi:hypothetical protein